jgi:hypothetical protein
MIHFMSSYYQFHLNCGVYIYIYIYIYRERERESLYLNYNIIYILAFILKQKRDEDIINKNMFV